MPSVIVPICLTKPKKALLWTTLIKATNFRIKTDAILLPYSQSKGSSLKSALVTNLKTDVVYIYHGVAMHINILVMNFSKC